MLIMLILPVMPMLPRHASSSPIKPMPNARPSCSSCLVHHAHLALVTVVITSSASGLHHALISPSPSCPIMLVMLILPSSCPCPCSSSLVIPRHPSSCLILIALFILPMPSAHAKC
eukprot:gene23923-1510_t